MTVGRSLGVALGVGGLLGLGVTAHAGLVSGLLELAGIGLLLGGVYVLLRPLAVERTCYRVRYTYPDTAVELDPHQVGARLALLARYGERISLCWCRQDAALALYLVAPTALDRSLPKLLPDIWPDAVLEPVATVPHPEGAPAGLGWQLRALRGAGQGGPADPLDFRPAPAATVSWLHWQRAGVALLEGRPTAAPGPATARGWRLPLRGRAGAWTARRWPWMTLLPAAAVRWPHTDTPATRTLDPRATLVLAPPDGYHPPARPALLGRSVVGDQPVGLDLADPGAWGHLLWLAPATPGRSARALRLLEQARAAGWGIVVVDGRGDLSASFYGQSPPEVRARMQRVDLLTSSPPLRPGLLAAPATTAAAPLAAALARAADEVLPAYLDYLGYLGLTPAGLGAAAPLVPAWVGVGLAAHYRARLVGTPAPALPEVPALLTAWAIPDDLDRLVQTEATAWSAPTGRLARALDAAGPAGAAARGAALALIRRGERVVTALAADDRRLYTIALQSRLAGVIRRAPALARLWADTQDATALLNACPAPLVLLDLSGTPGSEAGRLAAGWYGLYWLQVLQAVSRDRDGGEGTPLLVLWAGLAPAWAMVTPATLLHTAAALRAGGIHLVGLDNDLAALPPLVRLALPRAWDTWLLGTLPAAEAAPWDAALGALGAPVGFSCSALPPETAVVRLPAGLCTLHTDPLLDRRPPSPAARPVAAAAVAATGPGEQHP
jgi:hypothetical protein